MWILRLYPKLPRFWKAAPKPQTLLPTDRGRRRGGGGAARSPVAPDTSPRCQRWLCCGEEPEGGGREGGRAGVAAWTQPRHRYPRCVSLCIVSLSLSLSLSFPTTTKPQPLKPTQQTPTTPHRAQDMLHGRTRKSRYFMPRRAQHPRGCTRGTWSRAEDGALGA